MSSNRYGKKPDRSPRGNPKNRKKGTELKENRLERATASVTEQQEIEEQKRRESLKSRKTGTSITLVNMVRKKSPPTMLTMILSVILSTMLTVGFIGMVTTTYNLPMDYILFFILVVLSAWGMSYCHAAGSASTSAVLAVFLGMMALGVCSFDMFSVQTQVNYTYSILQKNAFHGLEPVLVTAQELEEAERPVTLLMFLISFIPTFFTTLVIEQRRNMLLALVWHIPFLICSTVIVYMTPDAWPCVLAVSGVLLLIVFQFVRKLGDDSVDERMLKISVPVVVLCCLVSAFFPVSGYDKYKLAEKRFTQLQSVTRRIGDWLSIGDQEKVLTEEEERMKNGFKGAIIADADDDKPAETHASSEEFSKVGYFNPPDVKLAEVKRFYNDTSTHMVIASGRMLYLRCASMEVLRNDSWKVLNYDEPRPEEEYMMDADQIPLREADYVLHVRPYVPISVRLVPEYVDHFNLSPESRYYGSRIPVYTTWNLAEVIPTHGEVSYNYSFNMVPAKRGAEWDPLYLEEEVYGTCLEVPEETRKSLMDSGVLPKWFLDLMDGTKEMSTAEKVGTVIEYVRNLHPYDAMTPYPPEGVDFVTWFIKDSKGGFCVHYSTTAAVLLRMLGVPTRYCSGYLVNIDSEAQKNEISMKDAHAWIEFFDPDYGWVMDDPTPGNGVVASYYNAYAVAKEYGDMDYDYRLSPTPKPKKKVVKNATPTPASAIDPDMLPSVEEESSSNTVSPLKLMKLILLHPIVMALLGILLVIGLLRLGYVMFWLRKFKSGTRNDQASAYDRYFNMHLKFFEAPGSRVVDTIVKKAEYSDEEISEKELRTLVKFGDHNLMVQKLGQPRLMRFLSAILSVKLPYGESAKDARERTEE